MLYLIRVLDSLGALNPHTFAEFADLMRARSMDLVECGLKKGSSPVGSGVFFTKIASKTN